jgi:hypothetical protein
MDRWIDGRMHRWLVRMESEATDLVNFSWPLVQAVSPLSSLEEGVADIDRGNLVQCGFDEVKRGVDDATERGRVMSGISALASGVPASACRGLSP